MQVALAEVLADLEASMDGRNDEASIAVLCDGVSSPPPLLYAHTRTCEDRPG